ncbi:hypothetical protein [Acidovorax soli]|uniref:hypothetical protein n=1 Tax=Acidovorax TaxID=12916 RepID=UPI0026E9A9A6|nr:hypothetical protein [Acidovorax soli]MCM2347046.1 hypothetical protein [Acidovorax soli]
MTLLRSTVGHGHSCAGRVKNRRKDGGIYEVRANVPSTMENGKPRAWLSVRTKPAEVRQAGQRHEMHTLRREVSGIS